MACFLLHSFVQREMVVDPLDARLDDYLRTEAVVAPTDEFISSVEATSEWSTHRELLAQTMWTDYVNGV